MIGFATLVSQNDNFAVLGNLFHLYRINSIMTDVNRLTFVGARRGHLPVILANINIDSLSPVPALALQVQ